MLSSPDGLHITIRSSVTTVFLVATLLTVTVAVGLQYFFGQLIAKQTASDLYSATADTMVAELRGMGKINVNVINRLADNEALTRAEEDSDRMKVFIDALVQNPLYYAIYVGSKDGAFYEVINLYASKAARQFYDATASDRWLIQKIENDNNRRRRTYTYLNSQLETRRTWSETTDFDVASRPWYQSAMSSAEAQMNATYIFAQLQVPGRTLSKRIADTEQVVAIDTTLATISEFLTDHQVAQTGEIYLLTPGGDLLASSKPSRASNLTGAVNPPDTDGSSHLQHLELLANDKSKQGKLVEMDIEGTPHFAYVTPVGSAQNPILMGVLATRARVFAPVLDKVKLAGMITTGSLLCLLPLSWFFANPIVRPVKQLAIENEKIRRRDFAQVERISTHVKELDELSESMVAMVEAIQQHEIAQAALMESIIKLIAEAIDEKSSYTGGHCERVPELALMLAEHASASDHPAFRDFRLETEDQWQEYRIAAWLHDCGKITTPEHIVDKGSKLETIYNRIHEVRTRFEVLWRDEEIAYWQRLEEAPDKREEILSTLQENQRQLQNDYAFVASCNIGGESLNDGKLDRLGEIAQRTWERHFSDRIGLSPPEEERLGSKEATLPATEKLLADRLEHLIQREKSTDYPAQLGIDMDIPEYESNLGELYNLSIARGTLSKEDRFRINEHMISTIKMLDNLPFPEELKNVPRYASTHHETMKGSGYPRKLSGEMLSIPERLLAVADIFEALTAADRPYKKAKPISAALKILHNMVEDNHIDRDCFELFVRENIYLEYARAFLPDSQIDEVNHAQYLST